MQLFRGGKVQILGCIRDEIAENMRRELILRLESAYNAGMSTDEDDKFKYVGECTATEEVTSTEDCDE